MKNNQLFVYLGFLQLLIAVPAIAGGLGLFLDPSGASVGMDVGVLRTAPFSNFLIPGIFLLVVNGLGNLMASVYSFRKNKAAGKLAIAFGLFLLLWMILQIWWIGFVHLLQPLYLISALLELVMGVFLIRQTLLHSV